MSTHIISEDSITELHRVWAFMDRYEPPPKRPREEGKRKVGRSASLEEAARILGVTREAVRQIENRALGKCKTWAEAHGYRAEDLLRGC